MLRPILRPLLIAGSLLAAFNPFAASSAELNLYSARHYQTDEALYRQFTEQTGIKINRVEASDEPLLQRLKAEGSSSPADVLMLVDAARLWRAQIDGLFQPIESKTLHARIPESLRGGQEWFAVSSRARVIIYNPRKVDGTLVQNYEDLARPELKGLVCTRSGAHPYMLSWIGSVIENRGAEAAEAWAKAVVGNMARSPRGGDTDQIKAVASGECGVAVSNSYYWVRILKSRKPEDQKVAESVRMVWPDQSKAGTHVNVSGAGVLKNAPNRDAAIKFIEYLASDAAQAYLANGNNEWPVVKGVKVDNPALNALGRFKADPLPIATIGKSQIAAQKLLDRAGWR